MKTREPQKDFDCVEFKRRAQARINERIKNLSPQEEIDYFRRAAEEGPLGQPWKVAQHRSRREPSAGVSGS